MDGIADRYNLQGVYGPLYRLFEVEDPKFNIATELTAGNRLVLSLGLDSSGIDVFLACFTSSLTPTKRPPKFWT